MTKDELILALEPFTGDIEICVRDPWRRAPLAVHTGQYTMLPSGEAILILIPGERKEGT